MGKYGTASVGLWVLLQVVTHSTAQAAVGRLPGELVVGSHGEARYSIPIEVPKGRGELGPTIGVAYNSNAGDGIAGVGWSLVGFSTIERCSANIPSDGERRGVQFSQSDRYCLDGQLLKAVTAGTCGDDTVEFRTEVDRLVTVTCHGADGMGPEYFHAVDARGRASFFGDTADSRIRASLSHGNQTRKWAISTLRDPHGNAIRYEYAQDSSGGEYSGEYWPVRIRWSDYCRSAVPCTDSSGNYTIDFHFENRPSRHARNGFVWGAPWAMTKRLKFVRYHTLGELVHEYRFNYFASETSGSTQHSILRSVSKCDDRGNCLGATTFDWRTGESGWDQGAEGAAIPNASRALYGDWDADGDIDVYVPTQGGWDVRLSDDGDLYANVRSATVASGGVANSPPFVLEFNGDGRKDLMAPVSTNEWQVFLANDFSTLAPSLIVSLPATTVSVAAQDTDGDGFDDLLYVALIDGAYQLFVRKNNGNAFDTAVSSLNLTGSDPWYIYSTPRSQPADFDGDGRADLLLALPQQVGAGWEEAYASRYRIYLARGEHFDPNPIWQSAGFLLNVLPLEINGDGLSDLIYYKVCFSTQCELTFRPAISRGNTLVEAPPSDISWSALIARTDFDGDGRDDVIALHTPVTGDPRFRVFLSDGSSFADQPEWVSDLRFGGQLVFQGIRSIVSADFQAAGRESLLLVTSEGSSGSSRLRVLRAQPGSAPLLTRLTDGLGIETDVVYATLEALGNAANPNYRATELSFPISAYFDALRFHRLLFGGARSVVERFTADDGVGGRYSKSFSYHNARFHTAGRGFLGFARIERSDTRSASLNQTTDYRQSFPYLGQVKQQTRTLPGSDQLVWSVVSEHGHGQSVVPGTGNENVPPQFVYESERTTRDYQLSDGQLYRIAVNVRDYMNPATSQLDFSHGAPFREVSSVSAPQTASFRTERVFRYDDSARDFSHCLGLPTVVDEFRTDPLGHTAQRERDIVNFAVLCQPHTVTDGPSSNPQKQRIRRFRYGAYGVVSAIHEYAGDQSWLDGRETTFDYGSGQWLGYRATRQRRTITPGIDEHGNQIVGPSFSLDQNFTYRHSLGLIASETNPQGRGVAYTHDNFGRMLGEESIDTSAGRELIYAACDSACAFSGPNAAYQIVHQDNDASSIVRRQVFDRLGREIGREDTLIGGLSRTITNFDAHGRVVAESVPHLVGGGSPGFITWAYDALSRQTSTSRPVTTENGTQIASTTTQYQGLNETTTDPNGNVTTTIYGSNGSIDLIVENASGFGSGPIVTDYRYDGFGNLLEIRGPGSNDLASTFSYDSRGFLVTRADAGSGARSFDYNAFGELVRSTDAVGNSTESSYDIAGRLIRRIDKNSTGAVTRTATWSYVGKGQPGVGLLRRASVGPDYSEVTVYDALARPAEKRVSLFGSTHVTEYGYDSFDRLQSMTYPASTASGRLRIRYTFDSVTGRRRGVQQLTSQWDDIYRVLAMDPLGRVSEARFGDSAGYVERLNFESNGLRLIGVETGETAEIRQRAYAWDAAGNLVRRSNLSSVPPVDERFTYDSHNRLISASIDGSPTLALSYMPNGSVASKSGVGDYEYDANRPEAPIRVTGARPMHYKYNANGELLCRGPISPCDPSSGGTWLTWNSANLLESIVDPAGSYAVFSYGPDRQRIREIEVEGSQAITRIHVAPHFQIESPFDAPTRFRSTVYFDGRPVFMHLVDANGELEAYYVHEDHMGSIDTLAFAYGSQSGDESLSFDPHGKRRFETSWADDSTDSLYDNRYATERGFAGHRHVDALKLIHMGGRVYDPVLGQMLSPDPIVGDVLRPQTLNRYAYGANNPLVLADPSGFEVEAVPFYSPLDEIVVTVPRQSLGVSRFAPSAANLISAFSQSSALPITAATEFAATDAQASVGQNVEALSLSARERSLVDDYDESQRRVGRSGFGYVIPGRDTARALLKQHLLSSLSGRLPGQRGGHPAQESQRPTVGVIAGSNVFLVLFGVSGSAGIVFDNNRVCLVQQTCLQIGGGAFAGVGGQGLVGFGTGLKEGVSSSVGLFAIGSLAAGAFGSFDAGRGGIALGGGFSYGAGGAAGAQFCRVAITDCL